MADTLFVDGVELMFDESRDLYEGARGGVRFTITRYMGDRWRWCGEAFIDDARRFAFASAHETAASCAAELTTLVCRVRAALEVPRG